MELYIIIGVVLFILIVFFIIFNGIVKLNNRVKEAFSTMDVYLKKRWDLIPNIVEAVKGYSKHEKEAIVEVIEMRKNTYDSMSYDEKIGANTVISTDMPKIMALAESYPELKASENFRDLSKELAKVEDEIANSRKYYNGTVRLYNNKVEMFPSNIVALILGYKSKKMFEAKEYEKDNINIEL